MLSQLSARGHHVDCTQLQRAGPRTLLRSTVPRALFSSIQEPPRAPAPKQHDGDGHNTGPPADAALLDRRLSGVYASSRAALDETCAASVAPGLHILPAVALEWCCILAAAPAAFAEDVVASAGEATASAAGAAGTYDPSGGGELIKNVVGVAYVVLVGGFLYRVLTRRAQRARVERLAKKRVDVQEQVSQLLDKERSQREVTAAAAAVKLLPAVEAPVRRTPLQALGSSLITGALAYGTFLFATKLQTVLDAQSLPDSYTVRNVGVTVRTILIGLVYLATFIFGANSAGLLGLAIQMVVDPKGAADSANPPPPPSSSEPQLPRISVRAKPEDMRRAFDQAARLPKAAGAPTPPAQPGALAPPVEAALAAAPALAEHQAVAVSASASLQATAGDQTRA